MLRTSLKLVAFSALICTGAVRADLTDSAAISTQETASVVESKKETKPAALPKPKTDAKEAPKAPAVTAPAQVDTEKAAKPSVTRFAQIKKMFARVTELPAAGTAVVAALKAKAFAHPYIAGAAAATVAAVVIYAIVAKAGKKPVRAARR